MHVNNCHIKINFTLNFQNFEELDFKLRNITEDELMNLLSNCQDIRIETNIPEYILHCSKEQYLIHSSQRKIEIENYSQSIPKLLSEICMQTFTKLYLEYDKDFIDNYACQTIEEWNKSMHYVLSSRTFHCLLRTYKKVYELLQASDEELLNIRCFGRMSLMELREILDKFKIQKK